MRNRELRMLGTVSSKTRKSKSIRKVTLGYHFGNSDEFKSWPHDGNNSRQKSTETSSFSIQNLDSLKSISLCKLQIYSLTCNIGLLTMTRNLTLCCNNLTTLPREIGLLQNLSVLNLSNNSILELPDTIGLLDNLIDLDLSRNKFKTLPKSISLLTRLTTLILKDNKLTSIPHEIGSCASLTLVDISRNQLKTIPIELCRIRNLGILNLESNPLINSFQDTVNTIPSLKELVAREIIRKHILISVSCPEHILRYLSSYSECSFHSCQGPFFESYIEKVRMVERNEEIVPLSYRLCSHHWRCEDSLKSATFKSKPWTASRSFVDVKFNQEKLMRVLPTRPELPILYRGDFKSIERQHVKKSIKQVLKRVGSKLSIK